MSTYMSTVIRNFTDEYFDYYKNYITGFEQVDATTYQFVAFVRSKITRTHFQSLVPLVASSQKSYGNTWKVYIWKQKEFSKSVL